MLNKFKKILFLILIVIILLLFLFLLIKKENKNLKKDLNRKEKALAETAALLVLKKKAREIWGEPEDD